MPPPPTDPAELLDTMLDRSGLAAANLLRRAAGASACYTVRDLLFHLPRRYDDLREMHRLGDLVWTEEGTVVSRARPRRRCPGRADLPPPGPAHDRAAGGRDRQRRRDLVRPPLHRAPAAGRRRDRRLRAGSSASGGDLTFDNPEFQPVGDDTRCSMPGRIVPVYPLTAGLTAARLRLAIREALDGRARLPGVPARRRSACGEGLVPIAAPSRRRTTRDSFEGRDAALRRLAFDELLALQLGMVARRRQRAVKPAPLIEVDEPSRRGHPRLDRRLVDREARPADRADRRPGAAMTAIRRDLARPTPMLRLLQGDVGLGQDRGRRLRAGDGRPGWPSRARCSRRPTCWHGSTSRRSAACSRALGLGVTLLTGSLPARHEGEGDGVDRVRGRRAWSSAPTR